MRAGLLLAVLGLAACAAPAPVAPPSGASTASFLKNAGFEADAAGARCPPGWGCSAHADPDSYAFKVDPAERSEGRQGLRIEQVRPEPWALVTQFVAVDKLRGARMRYSLAIRLEGMTGNGAGPVFIAQGTGGVTLTHRQELSKGTAGWRRVAIDFLVPRGAEGFEVGVLVEGPGRLWIDDARLEVLEPPQSP